MSNSTECGIMQLQIDHLLDNELDPKQQQPLLDHVRTCADCANELLLARSLRDAMLDLPRPELPPELTAKIFEQTARQPVESSGRISAAGSEVEGAIRKIADWFRSRFNGFGQLPGLRLAVPAFAALAAVAVWLQVSAPGPEEPPLVVEEQYSREDLVLAIEGLNTTIQTMNEISESMRIRLGDRMVSLPVLSLPALSVGGDGLAAPPSDDPI